MKRIFALLMVLALLLALPAMGESQPPEQCDHRYTLCIRADGLGYYTCFCTEPGCNEMFPVYPRGFEVAQPAEEENCPHLFRKAEEGKGVSIEAIGNMHHDAATWYDCTCELCGFSIEAYETHDEADEHIFATWEDVHIQGQTLHVFISHCSVCGYLECRVEECPQFEDGSCWYPKPNPSIPK